jgi:hypothetical protein
MLLPTTPESILRQLLIRTYNECRPRRQLADLRGVCTVSAMQEGSRADAPANGCPRNMPMGMTSSLFHQRLELMPARTWPHQPVYVGDAGAGPVSPDKSACAFVTSSSRLGLPPAMHPSASTARKRAFGNNRSARRVFRPARPLRFGIQGKPW